ncbi:MAG: tRNA guanosine(34) transglycosylase Tgt [Phycisphaeraceae bacterium]|nr:tRNA guanosine(34) transglycosylase Tgt [Phycisphaeraceae bacterium]
MASINFQVTARLEGTHARLGRLTTPHGIVDTPAFMPVGTRGTVKGILPRDLRDSGAQIILGNTYHLLLRPGPERIQAQGGLQTWTRWLGPMLTDSGGFQVFSLGDLRSLDDDGVRFRSHLDGSLIHLTPETSIHAQMALGADIIMAFDDCPPARQLTTHQVERQAGLTGSQRTGTAGIAPLDGDAYQARVHEACRRTARWLERCVEIWNQSERQALFGIVQGGIDLDLRQECIRQVTAFDLPGYAIGGVAVGEGFEELKRVVEFTAPLLPEHKPRYLMGVGFERDIYAAVLAGVDMFDCVMPTRNGRNGQAFTPRGVLRLRTATMADDAGPIDEACDCPACDQRFSRSYLRHLFHTGEMLGPILVSLHNLRHFQRFMLDIRRAIAENNWSLVPARWPIAVSTAAT